MDSKQTTPQPTNSQSAPMPPKSQQTISSVVNLSEKNISNIGAETIKYSIRTMAQDLERAKKEGGIGSIIKTPTMPPPPPTPKPTPIAPYIIPPPIKVVEPIKAYVPTAPTPLAIKEPIAMVTPIVPPPAIKKESIFIPAPFEIMPELTLKKKISSPESPIAPKPSFAVPITPSPILPTTSPITKSKLALFVKNIQLTSLPQVNLMIGVIVVVVALLSSVGFSYWWFLVKQPPIQPEQVQPEQTQPTETIPPVITEPTLPEKISQTDLSLVIEISTKNPSPETTSLLLDKISSSAKQQLGDKQLGRVLIKYSTDTEKSYLSFSESLALLRITVPNSISSNIKNGEILAYNQAGQYRYGFTATASSTLSVLNAMETWEKTILDDLNNLYIDSSPAKPLEISFNDDLQNNFIIRYLNLPDPTLSIAWAESNEKQVFIVGTSKDMLYKIIGVKEILKPTLKTYSTGTLVRTQDNTRIYRIIDDKKLWIPSIRAFLDSGYTPHSEIGITPEELHNFEDVQYVRIVNYENVYELKNDKKYLVPNAALLPQQEVKIVTPAELNAYPFGK